jgi:NTP pyrophosphatase (non-canonical NTP hydrolase)
MIIMDGKLLNQIQKLSLKENVSQEQGLLYVMEEVGEIALALTVKNGLKNRKLKDSPSDECIDGIICLLALFYQLGGTNKQMERTIRRKLSKWKKQLK